MSTRNLGRGGAGGGPGSTARSYTNGQYMEDETKIPAGKKKKSEVESARKAALYSDDFFFLDLKRLLSVFSFHHAIYTCVGLALWCGAHP